jgi:hypothetical protein
MVRKNSLFWGLIFVFFGCLLLLNSLGLIAVNVWGLVGPLFLILLGAWVIMNVYYRPRGSDMPAENVTLPLEGAQQANVRIHHGAGRLTIHGTPAPDTLAQGSFGGGLSYRKNLTGNTLFLEMRPRWSNQVVWGFPWAWPVRGSYDWNLALNREIPLSLRLETGAGESRIDLTDMCVTNLDVETGASSTDLVLPANAGMTYVRVEAGAASVNIHVLGGVAAQIRVRGGVSSTSVDMTRFPRQGHVFVSPDYATATNKVDINVEVGVGSVNVN